MLAALCEPVTETLSENCGVTVARGTPLPSGASPRGDGVNFSLFSRHATRVWLLLFADPDAPTPATAIELDAASHRTGDLWHVWVKGVHPGQAYAFRVDGPYEPQAGHRFNPHAMLLDPCAVALAGTQRWDFPRLRHVTLPESTTQPTRATEDDSAWKARCLVTDAAFDWQGDRPLKRPWAQTVIYETHIRGLTIHPSAQVAYPGTFLGVIEKIPYFTDLGITAVELMPVQEFNPYDLTRVNPETGAVLRNYWGYNPIAFLAPCEKYGTQRSPGCQVTEFKTMVKELHRAGIEVILDMVFNHTAEGDENGPTLHFRGLDNTIAYVLDEHDRRRYKNYSGCGNTVNCNHPVMRNFILHCLHYWVLEMHVDGFRFDLASVLGRDQHGQLLANPPVLERIAEDPLLRDVKLIAEAWDAGGAYQVGAFPGTRWSEWNSRYRDEVRRFWRGDPGFIGALATRVCGSSDLYQHGQETPINSINFVTCHDGLTLNDVVSYQQKYNHVNGEGDRDGVDENYSANYGVEGPTDDPAIDALRLRQSKNFLATLCLSRGVPMLLGGDEFRRTQRGNNNAYCQDNDLAWYDWTRLEQNRELFRFVKGMIAFRTRHSVLSREHFYTAQDVDWFTLTGISPDWAAPTRTLGWRIKAHNQGGQDLCVLWNADSEMVEFCVPAPPSATSWRVTVDTSAAPPADLCAPGDGTQVDAPFRLCVRDHAMVILVAEQRSL